MNTAEALITFDATSSAIDRVAYNGLTGVMTVWFNNTDTGYDFYKVPKLLVMEFAGAESQGRFYNQFIRGKYTL